MNLETEFRLCLQRQMLEWSLCGSDEIGDRQTLPSLEWAPSTWVRLVQPPSDFRFNEALLLCPYSDTQWLVWIPDHGEAVLGIDEFYEDEA